MTRLILSSETTAYFEKHRKPLDKMQEFLKLEADGT
jgi:hypothetical protein